MIRAPRRSTYALSLLGAAALPTAQGAYYFESNSTTEGDGRPSTAQVRGWIDEARARIEFVGGQAMPFASNGGYMLTNDGGETLYIVNPAERTYSELDLEQLLGMAGSMMQAMGGVVRMEFSDVVNEKLGEAPGGDILGYATTQHRYRSGYTMNMVILGTSRSTRVDTEQEFWCTNALDDAGFKVWLSPDRYRTGSAELDKIVSVQYRELDCLPLRSRIASVATGVGAEVRTVVTTEVTALREESAPAGTFDLPSGFTATELLPQMPTMPEMPSMPGANGGDSAPAEGARRPRLRDLLPGR